MCCILVPRCNLNQQKNPKQVSMRMRINLLLVFCLCSTLWLGAKPLHPGTLPIMISGVPVLTDTLMPPGMYNITYRVPADTQQINAYTQLLQSEYNKYPTAYVAHLGIKQIVLCSKLQLNTQARTAIPDVSTQTLYLEIDGSYGLQNPAYLIHVMHHELHHYAEYALWHDMYHHWPKWKLANGICRQYLGAGAMAYADPTVDWYSFTHPKKGFMNNYSTTAAEEDRCELVGLLMTEEGINALKQYYLQDARLRRKVKTIAALLNKISLSKQNYWSQQLKWLDRKTF